MAAPTKTADRTLITHQAIALDNIVVGSELDVSSLFSADVAIYHANIGVTANASGTKYLIQASMVASGNEDWVTVASHTTDTKAANKANIAGTEIVGSKLIGVGTGEESGFDTGDVIYLQDTGTLANSEWGMVDDNGTADQIDLVDGLTNAKDSADDVFDEAEVVNIHLDLDGIQRIRCVVNHRLSATGSTIHTKVIAGTMDAIA